MSHSKATLTKTFTTLSGMDAIAVLNDTVIGEFMGYEFTEKLGVILDDLGNRTNKKKFNGIIIISVFDEEPTFRKAMKPEDNEFTIFFANEYGQKAAIRFENIRFIKREGGLTLDDVTIIEKYYFECDDHYISNEPWIYDPDGEKPYRFINKEEETINIEEYEIENDTLAVTDENTKNILKEHGESELLEKITNKGYIIKIEKSEKYNCFKLRIKPTKENSLVPRTLVGGIQTLEETIKILKQKFHKELGVDDNAPHNA
jgi:hypothetical protein